MGKLSNYINAIRMVHHAHKRNKAGEDMAIRMVKRIPLITMSSWGATMEMPLMHNISHELSQAVRTVFYTFDEETQHVLTFTPEERGDWIERAQFWQRELKPKLPPKEYYTAISAILKWYIHCVRDLRPETTPSATLKEVSAV